MLTVVQGRRRQYLKRVLLLAGLVLAVLLFQFLTGPTVRSVLEQLSAPTLPRLPAIEQRVWLDQNWDEEMSDRFHHIPQGSHMLFVPLKWFLALEQPAANLFTMPFQNKKPFIDNDYLLRFGFIEGEVNKDNPHGLPIGFAATDFQNLPGVKNQETAIGFTCAACHTAHITHGGTEYLIEGGPASVDFLQLEAAMNAALGQTLISSQLPLVGGRFERFAERVLDDDSYNATNVAALKEDLVGLVEYSQSLDKSVKVVEGYTRLDALNRIGNTLFAWDAERPNNYRPPDAPVSFPHIWTASWFDWVQYDGSIMGPLIRNAGEAIGLEANIDLTAEDEQQRFSSSVDMRNLWWIENTLRGDAPYPAREFSGLTPPAWPDAFPDIDEAKAERGSEIYQDICIHCHLPPLDSDEIWSDEYFKPISYLVDGVEQQTEESLLHVNHIAIDRVGTDPARAEVLIGRTVNTAGYSKDSPNGLQLGLGLDAQICTRAPADLVSPYDRLHYSEETPGELMMVDISDGPSVSFALALGGFVEQVVDHWFEQNYVSDPAMQEQFKEHRPNCLQSQMRYKARPLNGIWATAPFLHNGAVPTLFDMVSPPDERPKLVQLGSTEFDMDKVGIVQDPNLRVRPGDKYSSNGLFILDTSIPGNSNQGHEFSDRWEEGKPRRDQAKGLLGPKFSVEDRLAIVEYLKTL